MTSAPAPKFIVAFSGGLDSTVLLHLCATFFGSESLLAVHVNHGLQSSARCFESQARRTCRSLGVALVVKRLKTAPTKGESVEAWARGARYQLLREVADQGHLEHIFTAHHQDDQVETLLIALSRGAGLDGLLGIAPHRMLGSVHLHRPLLDCPRSALDEYAKEHGLRWIEDPSNQDPRFLRNRIRRGLIPVLKSTLPGFGETAARSLGHLRDVATRLETANAERTDQPEASLSRQAMLAMSEVEQAATLRNWLGAYAMNAPSQAKLREIRKQLLTSQAPSVSLIHEGRTLRRLRDRLWVDESKAPKKNRTFLGERSAKQMMLADRPMALEKTPQGWLWSLPQFRGSLLIKARAPVRPKDAEPDLQFDALSALQVGPPSSAKTMQLVPEASRKTLKNLFQAAGVPAELRRRLPCVTLADEVVFVAGLGTAHGSPWQFQFLPDL